MWQIYETKAVVLTQGGLTDVRVNTKHGRNKVYREKSAEAVVPNTYAVSVGEGLNDRRFS